VPYSVRLSANLGFLWKELPLCSAIEAAAQAGFHAVECHWPYATAAHSVKSTLQSNQLQMLGINTRSGDPQYGGMGLAAIPGCEQQARDTIQEALDYAAAIDCPHVHVTAGGKIDVNTSETTYQDNLRYACELAAQHGQTILIEPLNTGDAPGYHISTLDHALSTIYANYAR